MDVDWREDVAALFRRRGRLAPETCPGLRTLLAQWTTDEAVIDAHRMAAFVSCVLWNADRREARGRTADDWTELLERRGAREAVLGFLYLYRMDESTGFPRTATFEKLVRHEDPVVRPDMQAHRQRWAALREAVFQKGEEAAVEYEAATLFEYGRRGVASGRYRDRLIADIERICAETEQLVVVLTDSFPINELRPEWVDKYQDVHEAAPINRLAADYEPRGSGISELDNQLETHHDASVFVSDLGFSSGSVVPQGTTVTVGWRIRNAGSIPWTGRRLLRLTPQTSAFPSSEESVPIADTLPGEEVDIWIDLTTTHLEGSSELRFKMVDGNGEFCFPGRYSYGLGVTISTLGTPRGN